MDSIKLTNIRCYGYTGFLPEERILGQWFEVNLTLWLDLSKSGTTDDIETTVDYRETITIVKQIIKTAKFALVERLAHVIAEDILKLEPITKVRVELSKPAAPIPDFEGKITIDITREK